MVNMGGKGVGVRGPERVDFTAVMVDFTALQRYVNMTALWRAE